jgi:acetylornithine/succinyldiaminopimelate/putrescine aminotransferase
MSSETSNPKSTSFKQVAYSLADLLGREYTEAVIKARARLSGESVEELRAIAEETLDFFPSDFQRRLAALLPEIGNEVSASLAKSADGATSNAFVKNSKSGPAPLSGLGYYRVGENGRLYLTTKSEHYHVPLGHGFPGYRLIENARKLGIPSATHNNTRGHITRLVEEELVRAAAGLQRGDSEGLAQLLKSESPSDMNRVFNLETGSLAVEAGVKMMLARFYRPQNESPQPMYQGRTPVFVVVGNDDGELNGNYHGTTTLTQMMRGLWPEMLTSMEKSGIMAVRCVRPNNMADLDAVFSEYETEPYKIAGFLHEIIMMNYGGRLLEKDYLRHAYDLCEKHDVPTLADEIQSCLWHSDIYMYREYDLKPNMLAIGKGFPGGEYPASRLLFSSVMDTLPQFGALVTNGQEELAALAYLITMRWAEENAPITREVGEYFEAELRAMASAYSGLINGIEGQRQLAGIAFEKLEPALEFVKALNLKGIDISVQTYKKECPPVALVKLPLIADYAVVSTILAVMHDAMKQTTDKRR